MWVCLHVSACAGSMSQAMQLALVSWRGMPSEAQQNRAEPLSFESLMCLQALLDGLRRPCP